MPQEALLKHVCSLPLSSKLCYCNFLISEHSKTWKHLDETPEEDLVENLCMFLKSVTKPDGSLYNSNTLKTCLNALSRHLINSRDIDIKKGDGFSKIRDILNTRIHESQKMIIMAN